MMERNVNERNSYVKSLQQLILCSKKELECFMQELNWIEELTLSKDSEKDLITCPVNSTHRVPSSNLHKHADACRLRQKGYGDDSVFLPPPCGSLLGTVVIDKDLQAKIILDAAARDKTLKIGVDVCKREVPQTSDRYTSDLTSDERRVLYDYVVERTAGKVSQPQDFSLPSVSEGGKTEPMTREQLFAAERDAKRRRVRYRSVKVHTKSKNYSEVMREVIGNQMAAYEDWLRDCYGMKDQSLVEQLEKRDAEETVGEKEEMEWLDWDFRSNPHTRWKYLLEREKRRAKRKETERHETQNKREEKSSRSRTHSRNKYENERENKHRSERELSTLRSERRDSYKKDRSRYSTSSLNERAEHNKYRRDRSNHRSKNRCSSEHEERDNYEKERELSCSKDYKKHDDHSKKDKYEKDRELSYSKDYKKHDGRSKKDKYEKDREFSYSKVYRNHDDYQAGIKTERLSDDYDDVSFDVEHRAKKKHKSDDKSLCEERMQELSDSNAEDQYSRSSSKKTKKRKKSKKKHKHKHKKNKKERRSSHHSNTTDSSDE